LILYRRVGRWAVGLLVAALCALLLWFAMPWSPDDADLVAATVPAAGGDMAPAVDDDSAEPPPPPPSDHTATDVIPPEEP
jgi:hypothetical protein